MRYIPGASLVWDPSFHHLPLFPTSLHLVSKLETPLGNAEIFLFAPPYFLFLHSDSAEHPQSDLSVAIGPL